MILYHLSSIYHLPTILSSGYLKTVESNVSLDPRREHAGPDVVWLTTSQRVGQGWARMRPGLDYVDKCRVIFELELPDDEVHLWSDWADAHGVSARDKWALAATGDEGRGYYDTVAGADVELANREWYVIERRVPWQGWLSVTDRLAGTTIWRRTPEQMESGLQVPTVWRTKHSVVVRSIEELRKLISTDNAPLSP